MTEWQPIVKGEEPDGDVLLAWFDPEIGGTPMYRVGFWHSTQNAWCDTHHVLHNQQSFPTHWSKITPPGGSPLAPERPRTGSVEWQLSNRTAERDALQRQVDKLLDERAPERPAQEKSATEQLGELLQEAGAQVQIGLRQQGHMPTVARMLAEGYSWYAIGRAIGWDANTARRWWLLESERLAPLPRSEPQPPAEKIYLITCGRCGCTIQDGGACGSGCHLDGELRDMRQPEDVVAKTYVLVESRRWSEPAADTELSTLNSRPSAAGTGGVPPALDLEAIRGGLDERDWSGRKHWDGCHLDRAHRDCAILLLIAEIERLRSGRGSGGE